MQTSVTSFVVDSAKASLRGPASYKAWLGVLVLGLLPGTFAYLKQLDEGLAVTGMSDQVTWGAYIANFTYLVGIAAAAVMLVIPAYVFHNKDAQRVVLLGEALAVAACSMALLFVTVDLGRPERFWHLIPVIGKLNFPSSLMSWDVIALGGYLVLNITIPFYLLYRLYRGERGHPPHFIWLMVVVILWALGIHTVTAFLYSSNAGRVFWHTALLGPRFLASAFASGPAFILLTFAVIDRFTRFEVPEGALRLLSLIIAGALQVNLFMLFSEAFTELYAPTEHSAAFEYLLLGHEEHTALVPWMWTAIVMEIVAAVILSAEGLRAKHGLLLAACGLTVVGVWIEKGMGLILPGFVPTPLGEFLEYVPSWVEVLISLSIWCFGALMFTLLARPILAVQSGEMGAAVTADGQPEGDPS
jgi:Ni/Fe-hydrogenase subunit HybB-like protein